MAKSSLPIAAVFLLALVLRVCGLTWGVPSAAHWYSYHPDESTVQLPGAVYNMIVSGELNPHFFAYPSLMVYATYFAYLVASGLGLSSSPASPFPWNTLRDIILCGRVLTAALGALTVFPVYGLGRAFVSRRAGLFAALLLALLPGHLQHSHFATVDVPATFFVALCLWLSARALESDAPKRWLLWSAVAAGLAAGSKYNAGIVIIAPIMAAWLRRREVKPAALWPACVALSLLVFMFTTPFAVLDFASFWGNPQKEGSVAFELLTHPKMGSGEIFTQTGNGWIYHLLQNAPFLLTWPVLIAAIVGACLTRRAPNVNIGVMMLAFAGLYFLPLGLSQVRFMRYLLPLCPILCVWAAWLPATVLASAKAAASPRSGAQPRLQSRVLHALLLASALFGALNALLPFLSVDPRDQAATRMRVYKQTAPVTIGLVNAPWFYTPPLQPSDKTTQTATPPASPYRLVITGFNTAQLKREKLQFFIISEYEWMEKQRLNDSSWRDFESALQRDYTLVQRFTSPRIGPRREYESHDYLYTHPEVRVYKRKTS